MSRLHLSLGNIKCFLIRFLRLLNHTFWRVVNNSYKLAAASRKLVSTKSKTGYDEWIVWVTIKMVKATAADLVGRSRSEQSKEGICGRWQLKGSNGWLNGKVVDGWMKDCRVRVERKGERREEKRIQVRKSWSSIYLFCKLTCFIGRTQYFIIKYRKVES